MKCYKCGNEIGEGFEVCPICATPVVVTTSPVANKVLTVFRDDLFIAICVLLSVSCGATIFSGNGVPLTSLLAMIFLWITYSKSRHGIIDVKNMRCVSGVVYAEYIIMNVCAIILSACGITLGATLSVIGNNSLYLKSFADAMTANVYGLAFTLTETIAVGMGWLIAGLFIFIGAIILLISFFAWKKLHSFVKSVYVGVQNGGQTPVVNAKIAKTWLWVFGIFSAIGSLGSLPNVLAFVAGGCSAAAYIIGAILVDRHFVEREVCEIRVEPTEVNE